MSKIRKTFIAGSKEVQRRLGADLYLCSCVLLVNCDI